MTCSFTSWEVVCSGGVAVARCQRWPPLLHRSWQATLASLLQTWKSLNSATSSLHSRALWDSGGSEEAVYFEKPWDQWEKQLEWMERIWGGGGMDDVWGNKNSILFKFIYSSVLRGKISSKEKEENIQSSLDSFNMSWASHFLRLRSEKVGEKLIPARWNENSLGVHSAPQVKPRRCHAHAVGCELEFQCGHSRRGGERLANHLCMLGSSL